MTIALEKLFNLSRLAEWPLSLPLLLLYTPLGLLLLLLRAAIAVQLLLAVALLPRRATITRLVVRCLCGVLGLFVRQQNLHSNPLYEDYCGQSGGSRRLLVLANHLSSLDHFALATVMPCVRLSSNGEGLPKPVSSLVGCCEHTLAEDRAGLHTSPGFLKSLRSFLDLSRPSAFGDLPLLVFPEEATTNGKAALLKYQTWPIVASLNEEDFARYREKLEAPPTAETPTTDGENQILQTTEDSEEKPVPNEKEVPLSPLNLGPILAVSIRVNRVPLIPLLPSTLPSEYSGLLDILSLLFCPLTLYTVRYLGRVRPSPTDTPSSLALRLQHSTAHTLRLQPSPYTAADKRELVKRIRTPPPPDYDAMAARVKEVLPHLPLPPVLADLARTKSVDATIANFLEGRVEGGASPAFSRQPSARMQGLGQRRAALLAAARQRYTEQYGAGGERDPYLH